MVETYRKMPVDNPFDFGTEDWAGWERASASRGGIEYQEATRTANERLAALRTSIDTPQNRAAIELDDLIEWINAPPAPPARKRVPLLAPPPRRAPRPEPTSLRDAIRDDNPFLPTGSTDQFADDLLAALKEAFQ